MRPHPTNPVIHLELHTGNLEGAVDFYSRLCGWRPERIHAGSSSYVALGMGDRVGGGVVECPAGSSLWLPYAQVPDVAETTDAARDLGGEVLLEPREGPEGWRSVVASPDGAEIAFWQQKNGHQERP
jgi:predicted enzyme related to lactoylglutathione lyase